MRCGERLEKVDRLARRRWRRPARRPRRSARCRRHRRSRRRGRVLDVAASKSTTKYWPSRRSSSYTPWRPKTRRPVSVISSTKSIGSPPPSSRAIAQRVPVAATSCTRTAHAPACAASTLVTAVARSRRSSDTRAAASAAPSVSARNRLRLVPTEHAVAEADHARQRRAGSPSSARPSCRSRCPGRRSAGRAGCRLPRRHRPARRARASTSCTTSAYSARAYMSADGPRQWPSTTSASVAGDGGEQIRVGETAGHVVDDPGARLRPRRARSTRSWCRCSRRRPASASARTTGSTRSCSTRGATRSAPGRVDSPPTSSSCAPSRAQPQSVRDRGVGVEVAAAVAERVGGHVDDPHDERRHPRDAPISAISSARAAGSASSPRRRS